MKLYWSWSINPQKVRLALNELGLPHEVSYLDLFEGEHLTPEFARLNLNRKLPVLNDDGFVLWESNAILAYLGERECRLWPLDAHGRGDAMRWLFFEARHLSEPIGTLWFNDAVGPEVDRLPDRDVWRRAKQSLVGPLHVLNTHLTARNWMLGADFTLVDCCYGALLDALSLSSFDLANYAAVGAYLRNIRARPSWRACEFRVQARTGRLALA
jgi:glutathione S-transferase